MVSSYKELSELSREELIEKFDYSAPSTSLGVSFYRQELRHRDEEEFSRNMQRLTRIICWLTAVVTVLTAVNVVAIIGGLLQ